MSSAAKCVYITKVGPLPRKFLMACFICGNENASLCQYCSLSIACSAHYHLHRNHEMCYPISIANKPSIGRCLVTTRAIQPGEIILQDYSAASGPKVDYI